MESSRTEARAGQLSMLTAGLAVGYQVAAKSLREGLFLSTFSVDDLPHAMLGAALCAMPVVFLVTWLMTRFGPARVAPAMFVTSAVLSLGEWLLLPQSPRAIALLVYFHVSIGGALLMSAFWLMVNERFDPHTLKQLVGRIGASATLGGLLGGAMLERLAHFTNARSTLLLVSGLCLAAAVSTQRLGKTLAVAATAPSGPTARARLSGYLWTLALLVACSAAASAFADFALKQAAVGRFTSAEELVRFFAAFYTGAALISFLLQALVARRLLETVGIGGTLAVPPILMVGLGTLALLAPSFVTIAALRGSDLSLGPSLFRSAFEPLFAPVPAATKRGTKALIDVVFDKGGDALASILIMAVALGGPALVERAPLLLAAVMGGLVLVLSLRAPRGYVAALEASLRAGTLNLDTAEVSDPTTRLTLSATALGIDRKMLLEQIAQLRQASSGAADPPRRNASEAEEQLTNDVRVLLGTDLNAVRALLSRPALDARLAAFIVPYLGESAIAKSAVLALRTMADEVPGLLGDTMLSPTQPLAVRRRVPHALRNARGQGAARALFLALSADALDVRYRAALALLEVTRHAPSLLPESKQVHALALAEASHLPLSGAAIDHIFALLSLCTSRGGLTLVRQGLRSDDKKLRGTALEYLESLLPESLHAPLVRAFAQHSWPPPDVTRSQTQLLDELKRSLPADLAAPMLAADPD